MKPRQFKNNIFWMGAIDWNRRLFDSLIPLPDGTSYNAYLIKGSKKTCLIDAVDPTMIDELLAQLQGIEKIDYIISHHTEQDHSGGIPAILERYPDATVLATAKAKAMLMDHLGLADHRIKPVEDGEKLSLGDKTLEFLVTPWVHWPETMCTFAHEDQILFSCDLFGSHLATAELYVTDKAIVYEAAKRYYAEIMMPFRRFIQKHIEKIKPMSPKIIAPSHGPMYDDPAFIIDAYSEWISEQPKNLVVIPYATMHGSTQKMVDYLVSSLTEKQIKAVPFNLAVTDLGKLAIELVDAATIILGTPAVHAGAHPMVVYAAHVANCIKPKARFASVVGSYGWGQKIVDQLSGLIADLKVEVIEPVLCKGLPKQPDYEALERLAATVAEKHRLGNLLS